MKIKNLLIMFLIILATWILLNNSMELEVLITGIVVAFALSLFFCGKCDIFAEVKLTPKAFIYALLYIGVFVIELVKSNIDVTRRVLSPSLPINPGIVEVKTTLKSKFGRLILANSITLTPGTLTIDMKDDSLFIHWIDVKDDSVEEASKEIVKKFEKYLEVIYG